MTTGQLPRNSQIISLQRVKKRVGLKLHSYMNTNEGKLRLSKNISPLRITPKLNITKNWRKI